MKIKYGKSCFVSVCVAFLQTLLATQTGMLVYWKLIMVWDKSSRRGLVRSVSVY